MTQEEKESIWRRVWVHLAGDVIFYIMLNVILISIPVLISLFTNKSIWIHPLPALVIGYLLVITSFLVFFMYKEYVRKTKVLPPGKRQKRVVTMGHITFFHRVKKNINRRQRSSDYVERIIGHGIISILDPGCKGLYRKLLLEGITMRLLFLNPLSLEVEIVGEQEKLDVSNMLEGKTDQLSNEVCKTILMEQDGARIPTSAGTKFVILECILNWWRFKRELALVSSSINLEMKTYKTPANFRGWMLDDHIGFIGQFAYPSPIGIKNPVEIVRGKDLQISLREFDRIWNDHTRATVINEKIIKKIETEVAQMCKAATEGLGEQLGNGD